MTTSRLQTRFAAWPPGPARLLLLLTATGIGACLFVAWTNEAVRTGKSVESFSDYHFHQDVVAGVHTGRWYYDVLPELFPKYDYVPFSVFNFRTPVYALVIGLPPDPLVGKGILSWLGLAALLMAYLALKKAYGPVPALAAVVLLIGAVGWCWVGPVYLFAEQWASVLIIISIFAYAFDLWPLGVGAGLAALFFRELALPYCFIALALAMWHRRWPEVAGWLAGFTLFGLFMVFHFSQVVPRFPQVEGTNAIRWVQFGGIAFVLQTCQMNVFQVFAFPWWFVAFYVPLAVLGLAGWRGELGARAALTALAYLAAFSVIGQWFNSYWGLMYAPLLSLGLALAPFALRDLWQAAWPNSAVVKGETP